MAKLVSTSRTACRTVRCCGTQIPFAEVVLLKEVSPHATLLATCAMARTRRPNKLSATTRWWRK